MGHTVLNLPFHLYNYMSLNIILQYYSNAAWYSIIYIYYKLFSIAVKTIYKYILSSRLHPNFLYYISFSPLPAMPYSGYFYYYPQLKSQKTEIP